MLEQAILREQFNAILAKERDAERAYACLVAETGNLVLRGQLEQLQRDKQRHIRLAERLLEIID